MSVSSFVKLTTSRRERPYVAAYALRAGVRAARPRSVATEIGVTRQAAGRIV
jgi:hypothetical protein